MSDRLDVIIFGASGYTGKRIVRNLPKLTRKEDRSITWGIAGRSLKKLQDVIREVEHETGGDYQKVPILIADTKNEPSLMEMTSKCKLLINCAGPFKYHGEPVVRACIRQGCHYIDVTAEPQFMERVQLLYHEEAEEKGVYVVPACGVDSILNDLGVNFLQKQFDGTINSVESYMEVVPDDGNYGTDPIANYATYQSFLLVMHDYNELRGIRFKLFPERINLEPKLSVKRVPHRVQTTGNLAVPYPGPDCTVVRQTQRYFMEQTGTRPLQIHTYLATTKIIYILFAYLGFLIMAPLIRFKFWLNLFLKYPKVFTVGMVGDNPTPEEMENLNVWMTLYGRGWKGKIVDQTYKEPEDAWIVAKVSARDPYESTAICIVISTIVLLDEHEKLPKRGGAYTPASCFADTNLVKLLHRNGIKFEIL